MAQARMVVGYVRVSTRKTTQDVSAEGQQFVLREQHNCDEVIVERISATGSKRRPGWDRLRSLVAQGKVARVIVSDLSRLARDGSDQQFLEEAYLSGTVVQDVHGMEYENHSIGGLLSTGVLSLVNRAQSRIIGLKVKEGVRRRRAAGHYGRPQLPFGYALVDGVVVQHPEHWAWARWLIEELINSDLNIYGTLRRLPADFPRTFTRQGLRGWLLNPILRGGIGVGLERRGATHRYERVVWDQAPALLTGDEWQTINLGLRERARSRGYGGRPGSKPHLLSGLIRCECCGKSLWWDACKSKPRRRYTCRTISCDYHGRYVNEEPVVELLKLELTKRARTMAATAATFSRNGPGQSPREVEIRQQIEALERLRDEGVPDLSGSISALKDELVAMIPIPGTDIPTEVFRALFSDPATFELATEEELRHLLLTYVERIDYGGSQAALTVLLRGTEQLKRL
jgi:DNA invertase Pin-like site-specific DNA recombinase